MSAVPLASVSRGGGVSVGNTEGQNYMLNVMFNGGGGLVTSFIVWTSSTTTKLSDFCFNIASYLRQLRSITGMAVRDTMFCCTLPTHCRKTAGSQS